MADGKTRYFDYLDEYGDVLQGRLGSNVRGYTITLKKNMCNKNAIKRFAERLNGRGCSFAACSGNRVKVSNASDEDVVDLVRRLVESTGGTLKTVLIGNRQKWAKLLKDHGLVALNASKGNIDSPGLYIVNEFACKGLEFDNVVVDFDQPVAEDEAGEKRLRYVHFTRARYRLYVRYRGTPPELLQKYYPDFLG